MRLVVIGGIAAGTKAASRAKRVGKDDVEVTVYQAEPEPSVGECGLPYLLSGVVEDRGDLVSRTPEQFAEKGVEVKTRHRVERLDAGSKTLVVRDLSTGHEFEDRYDRLVVATGANAVLLPVPGADHLAGVFALRLLKDGDGVLQHIEEHSPKKAVVVGGGYIGLEVAENLTLRGMEVTIVEAEDRVALAYGEEVAEKIEAHLEEKGVRILTGESVEEILGNEGGRVRAVRLGGGQEVEAGLVVAGVGVNPEVSLAKAAGAETGNTGALRVDRYLKTSLPDVWAAGDCVESVNLVTGEPGWVPLGDTANQMGRVAGTNAVLSDVAGKDSEGALEFPGTLGTGVFKVFDLAVGKTGLSEAEAREAGFEAAAAAIEAPTQAGYYPGDGSVFVKLVADCQTRRLLGAEAIGDGADKQIDIAATALWGRLLVDDLVNLDLAYAPPFGPALGPVIQAATVLSGRLG
jgi:NADPH-dependent 2,4-dienoyl-CoA reductase/sulfur reductase-like enzyme